MGVFFIFCVFKNWFLGRDLGACLPNREVSEAQTRDWEAVKEIGEEKGICFNSCLFRTDLLKVLASQQGIYDPEFEAMA